MGRATSADGPNTRSCRLPRCVVHRGTDGHARRFSQTTPGGGYGCARLSPHTISKCVRVNLKMPLSQRVAGRRTGGTRAAEIHVEKHRARSHERHQKHRKRFTSRRPPTIPPARGDKRGHGMCVRSQRRRRPAASGSRKSRGPARPSVCFEQTKRAAEQKGRLGNVPQRRTRGVHDRKPVGVGIKSTCLVHF